MVTELLVPRRGIIVPKLPSYVKLDMAFGVGSGATLFDKSRYRSHGAITGAAWAAGLHGYSLDFISATPSYVEIPAAKTQLDFTSEDFSIIARIKADDFSTYPMILNRGATNADGWHLLLMSDGSFRGGTQQSGATQLTYSTSGGLTTGIWYTIGFSRSGASIIPYKNGVNDLAIPVSHIDPATCARTAKIGIYDNKVENPFDGKIEFLRVFGGIALSASEHLAWHNALA